MDANGLMKILSEEMGRLDSELPFHKFLDLLADTSAMMVATLTMCEMEGEDDSDKAKQFLRMRAKAFAQRFAHQVGALEAQFMDEFEKSRTARGTTKGKRLQ